jgi:threonine dehydratase
LAEHDELDYDVQKLSCERIREARAQIDPTFLGSPLLRRAELDSSLGLSLFLKDETDNPIKSFKGRGTSLFLKRELSPGAVLVAASAGNFGQGLAYSGVKRGHPVIIFAAENANPAKVDAMRHLGAEVVLFGADFDAAKAEARAYARVHDVRFVEDGASAAIAEGAGTIAAEITEVVSDLDAIFVPLGNGALATGTGCWFKATTPKAKVVAVVAEGAPCMALSWREGCPVRTERADTIADGIAVRVPVPFAVAAMSDTIDDVMMVRDDELLAAMTLVYDHDGRVVEPAGVAGVAGLLQRRDEYQAGRVASVLCGANLTPEQIASWLPQAGGRGRSDH